MGARGAPEDAGGGDRLKRTPVCAQNGGDARAIGCQDARVVWIALPVLLSTVALAAAPTFSPPTGSSAAEWEGAAAQAGLTLVAAGQPATVELRSDEGWAITVHLDGGGVRTVPIAAPRGPDEREDVALLARSLLSPLGSRVHAPWAMAVTAQIRSRTGIDVEVMWGDEGFVVRFPEVESPPDPALLLPDPEEVDGLVQRQLGSTSLFAARFRETAARALLLPRRRPGNRLVPGGVAGLN